MRSSEYNDTVQKREVKLPKALDEKFNFASMSLVAASQKLSDKKKRGRQSCNSIGLKIGRPVEPTNADAILAQFSAASRFDGAAPPKGRIMRTRFMPVRTLASLACLTATPLAPDDVGEGIPIDPATASFAIGDVLCGISVAFPAGDAHLYPPVSWRGNGEAQMTNIDNTGVCAFVHPSLAGSEAARLLRALADQVERAELHRLPIAGIAPRVPDRDAAESLLARAILLAEGCHPIAPARLPTPPAGMEYDRHGKLRIAEPDDDYVSEVEEIEEVCDAAAE